MNTASVYDSLHPQEINLLAALGQSADTPASDASLQERSQLEPSQLSMALGWLQAKALIRIHAETSTAWVGLTEVGHGYLATGSPPEWIVNTCQQEGRDGHSFTVKDLQEMDVFPAAELSRAIGLLKQEGAIRLTSGGHVETTETPSPTIGTFTSLLHQLRESRQTLLSFSHDQQTLLRQYAVKRGSAQKPFRIEERVQREVHADGRRQNGGATLSCGHRGRSVPTDARHAEGRLMAQQAVPEIHHQPATAAGRSRTAASVPGLS